jgi:hypothetical protein
MGFNDGLSRDTHQALETVNVLREDLQKQAPIMEKADKGMRNCRSVIAWCEFASQSIEPPRVLAKTLDIEDILRLRNAKVPKLRVDTSTR